MSIFDPASFARFISDVTTGPSDLLIPAEHLEAVAPLLAKGQPTAEDFDFREVQSPHAAALVADFRRELAFPGRLGDVLTDWSL